VLNLLGPITLRRLREHKVRSLLTLVGISLGVAVLVAVATVNEAVVGSFADTLGHISGKVHLEVSGGATGLDEQLVDKVRALPGVRYATPVVQQTLEMADEQGETLGVLGVNFTEDPEALAWFWNLRPDDVYARPEAESGRDERARAADEDEDFQDPFEFLNATDRLIVSRQFADRHGVSRGGKTRLITREGTREFEIYAVVDTEGPARAYGGNLAIMDYQSAQEVFGKVTRTGSSVVGHVDRIDIAIDDPDREGAIDDVTAQVRAALGDAFEVERPSKRQQRTERLLRSFRVAFFVGSSVALLVGMFLIYHTLSVSVVQRRTEIGILRAVGTTRGQIIRLFSLEGWVFGLLGSAVGLGLGALLSRGLLQASAQSISEVYIRVHATEARVPPIVMVLGLACGTGCALLASYLPARAAARLSPVETIRSGALLVRAGRITWIGWREVAAALLFLAIVPCALVPAIGGFPLLSLVACGLAIGGFALLARSALRSGMLALAPFVSRVFGFEGTIASDNLRQSQAKSAGTVASLMVGLAMVLSSAIMTSSFRNSIHRWVDQVVPADLFVTSSSAFAGVKNQPMEADIAGEIARIDGIVDVDLVRIQNVDYGDTRIALLSLDTSVRFRHGLGRVLVGGGDVVAFTPRLQGEDTVIVSESFAAHFGKGAGDRILLPTAEGERSFEVLGVMVDYTSDQGMVFFDRALWKKYWHDELVDTIEPYTAPGADLERIRAEIARRWGKSHNLFILTNAEFRAEIGRLIEQVFAITRALEAVTILIALLSVVNTLLTSVLDRTRELGVLRAIGALRSQIRRVVLIEAGCISVVGSALGVIAGTAVGFILIKVVNVQNSGWRVGFSWPAATVGVYALLLVVVGVVAAVYPAWKAARMRVVDALAYE